MLSLVRMEMDRVAFMLKSYLRVRLQKIEQYVLYYVSSESLRARMSASESVRRSILMHFVSADHESKVYRFTSLHS